MAKSDRRWFRTDCRMFGGRPRSWYVPAHIDQDQENQLEDEGLGRERWSKVGRRSVKERYGTEGGQRRTGGVGNNHQIARARVRVVAADLLGHRERAVGGENEEVALDCGE